MKCLVLSGGGMFGAYQAGAWDAIRRVFEPDIVIGASVGSLNAWLLASNCSSSGFERRWLRDPIARGRRRFPGSRHDLEVLTRGLVHEFSPVRPIGVVATELWRLKPRLFRDREITWRHLAASCAIPGLFPLPKIDGIRYCDGGLLAALPVWAAVQCGATEIVAVHCLPKMPAWIRLPLSLLRKIRGLTNEVPAGVRYILIAPAEPLGSLRQALEWNPVDILRWIEQGKADARQVLAEREGGLA